MGATDLKSLFREVLEEHTGLIFKVVLWWYLLPIAVGVAAIHIGVAKEVMNRGDGGGLWLAIYAAISLAVFGGVYWLNQYVVRTDLEPRRQELLAIRESLIDGDDSRGDAEKSF